MKRLILAAAVALLLGAAAPNPASWPEQRADMDLSAQVGMQVAAEQMVQLTRLQIALTIAGTLGLFLTLAMTRASIRQTELSLAVSQAGHTLQEDVARRQLRAYLAIKLVRFDDFREGQRPNVFIVTKNSGQTPAYNVAISVSFLITGALDPVVPKYHGPLAPVVINPGDDQTTFRRLPEPVTSDQMIAIQEAAIVRGGQVAEVVARVTFDDAFGNPHEVFGGWSAFGPGLSRRNMLAGWNRAD